MKGEAFRIGRQTMTSLQFVQWTRVQRPHGTSGDTYRLLALRKAIDTQVALLHLGVWLRPELRRRVAASLETHVAIFMAQAGFPIDHDDPIGMSLGYRANGTGGHASRFFAVITEGCQMGYKKVREPPFFERAHSQP